jgi:hypothetical protein
MNIITGAEIDFEIDHDFQSCDLSLSYSWGSRILYCTFTLGSGLSRTFLLNGDIQNTICDGILRHMATLEPDSNDIVHCSASGSIELIDFYENIEYPHLSLVNVSMDFYVGDETAQLSAMLTGNITLPKSTPALVDLDGLLSEGEGMRV